MPPKKRKRLTKKSTDSGKIVPRPRPRPKKQKTTKDVAVANVARVPVSVDKLTLPTTKIVSQTQENKSKKQKTKDIEASGVAQMSVAVEKTTVAVSQTQEIEDSATLNALRDFVIPKQTPPRPIVKEDLIQRTEVVFSALSHVPHKEEMEIFLRNLFGIEVDSVGSGLIINEKDSKKIFEYISKCCEVDAKGKTEIQQKLEMENTLFLDFLPSVSGSLQIYFKSIGRLMSSAKDGYLDDPILDLFTDVINLLVGAYRGQQDTPLPSMVCMKHFQLQHLWALAPHCNIHPTLNLKDEDFPKELKRHILDGHVRNNLASIINHYLMRKDKLDFDFPLDKVLAVINIANEHFIQASIDFTKREVTTRDSLRGNSDLAYLERKWIAKITSISLNILNNRDQKEIYFGNLDMSLGKTFNKTDLTKMPPAVPEHGFSFFHHMALNDQMFFPPQTDGFNCGIYAMWYMLLTIYEDKVVEQLNPLNWRRQTIFFIFILHLYNKKICDSSYKFPNDFTFKSWLMEGLNDNDVPKEIIQSIHNILEQKVERDEMESKNPKKEGTLTDRKDEVTRNAIDTQGGTEAKDNKENNPIDTGKKAKNPEKTEGKNKVTQNTIVTQGARKAKNKKENNQDDTENEAKNPVDTSNYSKDGTKKTGQQKESQGKESMSKDSTKHKPVDDLNKKLDSKKSFMQHLFMDEFSDELAKAMSNKSFYYHQEDLSSLVVNNDKFPDSLGDLCGCRGFSVTVNVYYSCSSKNHVKQKFQEAVQTVFTMNKSDKTGLNYLLKQKDTIYVSVEAQSNLENKKSSPIVLAFGIALPIYDKQKLFQCLHVDYVGTTWSSPINVITDYDHKLFHGKGLGKFIINLLQIVAWNLSSEKYRNTKLLLKADEERKGFYENIGFTELAADNSLLEIDSMQVHSTMMKLDRSFKAYILDHNKVIDHKKVTFINHVHQATESVPLSVRFTKEENKELKQKIIDIISDPSFKQKIEFIKINKDTGKHEGFVLPIGDVITQIFDDYKPPALRLLCGLYEFVIKQLSWEITVTQKIKVKKQRSSVDDVKNPIGEIMVICNKCKKCKEQQETKPVKYHIPFPLLPTNIKEYGDGEQNLTSQTIACLDFFFDHFGLNKQADCSNICSKLDITELKNIRDEELMFVVNTKHLQDTNKESFKRLVHLFLQTHLYSSEILRYYNWQTFRPTRFSRLAKLNSTKEKMRETEAAVRGTNQKELQMLTSEKQRTLVKKRKERKMVKDWESFWDDMIFLNRLRQICYVDSKRTSKYQMTSLTNIVSNPSVINEKETSYFIGYPQPGGKQQQGGKKLSRKHASRLRQLDNDEDNETLSAQTDANDEIETENEDAESEEDKDTEKDDKEGKQEAEKQSDIMIRVLEKKWVHKFIPNSLIKEMKKSENNLRRYFLSEQTLEKIKDEMKKLRVKKVTHIYKYRCPISLQPKFLNAIPRKGKRKQKRANANYEKIDGDEVTQEWLHFNTVVLNKCNVWYKTVMDPKKTNCIFELPITATVNEYKKLPKREDHCPTMRYPQNGVGACGIAALSSAFHYTFSETLSLLIHQKRHEYLECLSDPISNKKSPAMVFLMKIIFQKPFNDYSVKRIKQMIPWTKFLENPYYKQVILCIPKSSCFSRDHIIGISRGWIFDGNLPYGIPLNEENLTWCTSHGREDEVFAGFWEQVQVFWESKDRKKKVNNFL